MEDLERKPFYILEQRSENLFVLINGSKVKSYSNIKSIAVDRIYYDNLYIFDKNNGEILKKLTINHFIKEYVEKNPDKNFYYNYFK